MCHHRYLLERRPNDDYTSWTDLDEVPMDGGVRITAEELHRGHRRALDLARIHGLADPDTADQLVVTRFTCCGPEESERPYAEHRPEPVDIDIGHLAREVVRLRTALAPYADRRTYDAVSVDGRLVLPIYDLGPEHAQKVLHP